MIVPIDRLKPLEKVFRYHLKNLSEMILKEGIVQTPIIADKKHGIVLDGSHRYIFFLMNGFKEVPVKFVDYEDEHIRVGSRLIHRHLVQEKIKISKKEVVRRGLKGDLFYPRTTRHFFPFRKNERINIPLDSLKKGRNIDVESFIANSTFQDEIDHNQKYLSEIEKEFDELIRYMEEIRQTKNYLKTQILMMQEESKPVAFFPGKFQPVHMGHITSLMRIFDDYDKIIIGITSDSPNVLSLNERKEEFAYKKLELEAQKKLAQFVRTKVSAFDSLSASDKESGFVDANGDTTEDSLEYATEILSGIEVSADALLSGSQEIGRCHEPGVAVMLTRGINSETQSIISNTGSGSINNNTQTKTYRNDISDGYSGYGNFDDF